MKIFKKILTGIDLSITWPIYILSLLFPRSKKIWVFIGWHLSINGEIFADNTKYFFLYTNKCHPEITSIWIAKDKNLANSLISQGYKAYYEKSFLGYWYSLRAGVTVIDAFLQRQNFRWSGRSTIVQLLHGKGLKRKGYSKAPLKKNNFIFGTSNFANSLLPCEFTQGAQMHVTGYSRNNHFFSKEQVYLSNEESGIVNLLKSIRNQGKKVVMYAPTFRRGQKTLNTSEHFDRNRAEIFAKENNMIFLVSQHTKYRAQKGLSIDNSIIDLPECDINAIMPYINILITDYSSSYIDFLLLDRPIIFYVYDLESYNAQEGLIDDYLSHMPGEKVKTELELFTEIKKLSLEGDNWVEERKKVRDMYHTYQDSNSSERIYKIVKNI